MDVIKSIYETGEVVSEISLLVEGAICIREPLEGCLKKFVSQMRQEIELISVDNIFHGNIEAELRSNRKRPTLICGDVYPRYHFKHLLSYFRDGIPVTVLTNAGDIIFGYEIHNPVHGFINWGGNVDDVEPFDILIKPAFLCSSFENYFKYNEFPCVEGSVFNMVKHSTNLIKTLKLGVKSHKGTGEIYVKLRQCIEAIIAKIESREWA